MGWVLLVAGLVMIGLGIRHVLDARRRGLRSRAGMASLVAIGAFFGLLAAKLLVEDATGQAAPALTVAAGLAAIAAGLYLMFRTVVRRS